MWSWRYTFALVVTIIGLALLVFFSFHSTYFNFSFNIDSKLANEFGGFIGGLIGSLFSLAGILLLFETLNSQKFAFQKQLFENKYFELINYHRENVQEMKHKLPNKKDEYEYGRRVFIVIREQFGELYEKVNLHDMTQELSEDEKIDVTYQILFYGVGDNSLPILRQRFEKYVNNKKIVINHIIDEISKIKDVNNINKRWGGHQSRLGHYFRHLFQTVKYVDNTPFLSAIEKYEYIKILRAQLSTYEIAIIFFNSLSSLGEKWELKADKTKYISEYKFIKNLPPAFTFNINPKKYYKFKFEYEE